MTSSDSFNTFLNAALEIGVANAAGGRGAFHPVLVLESASGERSSVIMYVGQQQPPEVVIPAACATLRDKLNLQRYAVVSSLTINLEGRSTEAIGIEAAERGMESGVFTVVPFKRRFLSSKVDSTGDPILAERPPNHLGG
jgi:hypothetical protein